jgi:hypothetical protein
MQEISTEVASRTLRHVPPKRWITFNGLHSYISIKKQNKKCFHYYFMYQKPLHYARHGFRKGIQFRTDTLLKVTAYMK